MTILEARGLSKWYGNVIAVNDVTVDVRPGITGLLGPNGAGKSTFMKLAMGLARPSKGEVTILGENPWDNPQLLKRVGFVPEGDPPWRDRTGRESATLAARLSGLSAEDAKVAVERALERASLLTVADRKIETYSRGTKQRFKIALALLNDPELLILDEPLLGTDPISRKELIQMIRDLAKSGKSVVLSTHILPDVEAMTQRILLIHHGRVAAHGEVQEIRDLLDKYPRTVRVATSEARKLGQTLSTWPTVESVRPDETMLVIETRQPRAFYEELQTHLAKGDVMFTSITSPDDSVETLFRYLVG